MTRSQFFQHFDLLADQPDAVAKMRELVWQQTARPKLRRSAMFIEDATHRTKLRRSDMNPSTRRHFETLNSRLRRSVHVAPPGLATWWGCRSINRPLLRSFPTRDGL